MRNNLLILFGVLLLGSCASTTQTPSYREQLDIYKDMKIRLYRVASLLRMSVPIKCPQTTIDTGIIYHSLSDYPEKMRPVAASYWGLGAGKTRLYYQQQCPNQTCRAPIILDYSGEPNAYTDGDSIFISPALLNKVDDLALSLIVAHELAHIALKHGEQDPSEKIEREADRMALYILALAELDYHKAAMLETASRPPRHLSGAVSDPNTQKRAQYFQDIVAEIDQLKADGKPLVP